MKDFEKKGSFYLGRIVDPATGKLTQEPLLYDSKNFTTHAICLGMTGSGKTGLGIAIIEEAGLNGIPAIIIDPKGDLSNLALTFPNLSAEEFMPWVDEWEAEEKNMTQAAYAAEVAKSWKKGLEEWGEGSQRIKKLKDAAQVEIYTPANRAGIPLSILKSFEAPPKEMMEDEEAIRDRVMSLASSLLGLIGIDADPIKSREHIFISKLIEQAWQEGDHLTLEMLIQLVQRPPFKQIGALDVETFFPTKERRALSVNLNNLLASPGFQAWMEGEPLDIQRLLYTEEKKPKFSILSLAHLSDSERMFFVTLLLNEIISWMRQQSGTSNLRALLYMDEIAGYFPPVAAPPSKRPMVSLLKQARAYGLGIVLSTQNPVDLDYKGLSNCGTWFIGKLQTERDKMRVLDGLTQASNGELDSGSLKKLLGIIEKRLFIMRSIYEKEPVIFKTRWTLSYLRGPLTLPLIRKLTPNRKSYSKDETNLNRKPMVSPAIAEVFIHPKSPSGQVHYVPAILATGKMHFVDAKLKIDLWKEITYLAFPVESGRKIAWEEGKEITDLKLNIQKDPLPNSDFAMLPEGLLYEKNYASFKKDFLAFLYQNETLSALKDEEFKKKLIESLNEKYDDRIAAMQSKVQMAQNKLSKRQKKAFWQKLEAFLSFLAAILGAFIGRGVTKGTITQTGTSIRRAGKIGMESQDSAQAEESYQAYLRELEELKAEKEREIERVSTGNLDNDAASIAPRKSDLALEDIALAWVVKEALE